jgi:hypothetical protein
VLVTRHGRYQGMPRGADTGDARHSGRARSRRVAPVHAQQWTKPDSEVLSAFRLSVALALSRRPVGKLHATTCYYVTALAAPRPVLARLQTVVSFTKEYIGALDFDARMFLLIQRRFTPGVRVLAEFAHAPTEGPRRSCAFERSCSADHGRALSKGSRRTYLTGCSFLEHTRGCSQCRVSSLTWRNVAGCRLAVRAAPLARVGADNGYGTVNSFHRWHSGFFAARLQREELSWCATPAETRSSPRAECCDRNRACSGATGSHVRSVSHLAKLQDV